MPSNVTKILRKGAFIGKENAKEGIINGRPEWMPLSERTISRKGHDKILFEVGILLNSIDCGAVGDMAWYGTSVEYGAKHEFGLDEPRVPKRSFLLPTVEGFELQSMVDGMVNYSRVLFLI